jgi:hypothetical protein
MVLRAQVRGRVGRCPINKKPRRNPGLFFLVLAQPARGSPGTFLITLVSIPPTADHGRFYAVLFPVAADERPLVPAARGRCA